MRSRSCGGCRGSGDRRTGSPAETHVHWAIRRENRDEVTRAFLERDRDWAAYLLADLEPPHRPHARFYLASTSGTDRALLLAVNNRLAPPDRVARKRASDVAAVLVRSVWDSLNNCQFSVASSQSGQCRRLLTTVN